MDSRKIMPSSKIYLGNSKIAKAGRGVFTKKPIKKGEIVETCPVLTLPRQDYNTVKKTILHNYYFMWGKVTCGICLGFGSLYNHSYNPNATYKKNIQGGMIKFVEIKDIKKDEEISVNYNYGDPDNKKELWIKEIKQIF